MSNQQYFDQTVRFLVYLESFKQSEVDKFTPRIKAIDQIIRDTLLGEELTDLTVKSNEGVMAVTRASIQRELDLYTTDLDKSLTDLGVYSFEYEVKSINNAYAGAAVASSETTQKAVKKVIAKTPLSIKGSEGKLITDLFKNFGGSETERYINNINLARYEGKTNSQISQIVRGTRKNGYKDGLLDVTARQASTITRTTVQHAAMQVKKEFSIQNSDIIVGEKMLATLDGKTSAICRWYDQKVFRQGVGRRPPFHYNCRTSFILVIHPDYAGDGEIKTRASKDGPTENVSYYKWLKKQPKDFQEDVLGKSRAKLMKSGGLSSEKFSQLQLDKNFNPLTLDQMRQREPTAFRKAGL